MGCAKIRRPDLRMYYWLESAAAGLHADAMGAAGRKVDPGKSPTCELAGAGPPQRATNMPGSAASCREPTVWLFGPGCRRLRPKDHRANIPMSRR